MLQFSSEHMSSIPEAYMLLDGDSVLIGNREWVLVVTGAEAHLPTEILEILTDAPSSSLVDWRVLRALEFYPEARRFLYERGNQSFEIYHPYFRIPGFSGEGIRRELEEHAAILWSGTHYHLDQMFAAGAARVEYSKGPENERRRFAEEPAAQLYIFTLDGRLLAVHAAVFRMFFEMGFSITCPTEHKGPPPFVGLSMVGVVPPIFGFLRRAEVGRRQSKDGRDLHIDVGAVSWFTPEEGLSALRSPDSYEPGDATPATERIRSFAASSLLMGVAILRWHDLTDTQINVLYDEGRTQAMVTKFEGLVKNIRDFYTTAVDSQGSMLPSRSTLDRIETGLKALENEGHWLSEPDVERLEALKEMLKRRVS